MNPAEMVAMLATWSAGLLGLKMVFNHRAEMRRLSRGESWQDERVAEELEAIRASLEDLRTEVQNGVLDLQDRVGELSGRVEFAERLLAKPRDS